MKDIYDIAKELKNISADAQCDEIRERINNVTNQLNNLQADIFKDLSSIDAYSNGDEIAQAILELMEKIDYKNYCNNYCNMTDESGNRVVY